jgi:hypothetical protein
MMKSLKVSAVEGEANEGVKWRREEPLLREHVLHGADAAGKKILGPISKDCINYHAFTFSTKLSDPTASYPRFLIFTYQTNANHER